MTKERLTQRRQRDDDGEERRGEMDKVVISPRAKVSHMMMEEQSDVALPFARCFPVILSKPRGLERASEN